MQTPDVLIAGGGPCGLLSALLLARQGVRSWIIERHSGISTHPKAMGVQRRTAEIYRSLGLLDRMMERDLPAKDLWLSFYMKSLAGEEIGRIPLEERTSRETPCIAFHCPQTWTESVLLEAVSKEERIGVCFSREARGVSQDEAGVSLTVTDASGSEQTISAPWLIAADGAGSFIRRSIGVNARGLGDMGHFLNVHFRADYGPRMNGRNGILFTAVCPDYAEMFVAVNGTDEWLMHHFLDEGETLASYPHERLIAMIRNASGMPEVPIEILGVDPWVMSPKVAETFRRGRILLTGDASARLSPAGGLGLNTGMQSVHNLAWKLASVVKGEADESLLDTYDAERRSIALARMSGANKNADEVITLIRLGLEAKWEEMREILKHSRRSGSGLGEDIGVVYREGAFVPDGSPEPVIADDRNDYHADARPGSRAPHAWLTGTGGRISTIDLFHTEFVLIVCGDGSGWRGACTATQSPGVRLISVGADGGFASEDGQFSEVYGIREGGAVLVRPDGIVAARIAEEPESKSDFLRDVFVRLGYIT